MYSTGEFRNAFLKTIRQIIRESVRNMSIPTTKSLSRNDRYGGGTSTSSSVVNAAARRSGDPTSIARTLSNKKKSPRGPQRHSAGNIANDVCLETYDNVDQNFRTRSKTVGDAIDEMAGGSMKDLSGSNHAINMNNNSGGSGSQKDYKDSHSSSDKSEKDFAHKPMLGRTPNHLSLSTTSTLSTGSAGSTAAKLIQSSTPPTSYQPQKEPPAGSPVWKPREGMTGVGGGAVADKSPMLGVGRGQVGGGGTDASLPPSGQHSQKQYFVYDEYGGSAYLTPPSAKKDQFVGVKHADC